MEICFDTGTVSELITGRRKMTISSIRRYRDSPRSSSAPLSGRNRSMSLLSEPVTLPYLDTPNEKREAHAISDGGSDKAQYRNLHELTLLGIA